MLILFFSAFIVLLSIQIHFCEELSIEIGSYLAQSSDFENLAEYPQIPAETGVKEAGEELDDILTAVIPWRETFN